MRIVMIAGTWQATNGVVTSVRTFRKGLEALGHQVRILVPEWTVPELEPGVIGLPARLLTQDYYRWKIGVDGMVDALGGEPVDLIHVHHLFQTGHLAVGLARRLQVPIVATYHTLLAGYAHYVSDYLFGRWKPSPNLLGRLRTGLAAPIDSLARLYMPYHTRTLLNQVNQVIAPSRPILRLLRRQGVRQPIAVIPTGIHLADYTHPASNRTLEKLGIDPKRQIILSVGRLAKEKNIWRLLEVFNLVHQALPDVQLVLVGPGPEEEAVRQWLIDHQLTQDVIVTGRLEPDRLKPLFGRADVFFFPSLTDTQAIVVVEALAAGTPAVVSNQNGPATIVIHNRTGFVCSDRTEAYTQELTRLLTDQALRTTMGAAAREDARRYADDATARAMAETYQSVLHRYSLKSPLIH